jgi:hypothetical protein
MKDDTYGVRLPQRWLLWVLSPGIQGLVVRWKPADVSEEYIASILRIQEYARQRNQQEACYRVCLPFLEPWRRRRHVFRNADWLSADYTKLRNHHCENLNSYIDILLVSDRLIPYSGRSRLDYGFGERPWQRLSWLCSVSCGNFE